MGQVELEVVDSDGKPRAQMVYMDLRSVPNKDVARLFAAVARLAKAMNMVEADAKKKTMESQKKATAAGEKHKDSRALGEWAKANARSGNKEEARRLHRSMPEEVLILASGLVDPERVIYDAIRKKRKSI
ncbi:MAG TPA: hypothetical protein PKC60_03255 [Hydrogenophaga sp.]|uniref:hypothetical protein n=1 Tax=Hydrogenophaga sp. TaxID=1904254 RepID=UPI002CBC0226|nr:hypothetical protein [Hydrogenophaga sp.]HMN92227.1 hypothetical protein [Hydrogenophaga sp.]HMP11579.1 hypothetical protein [Hydrogenophaga sp.]